MPEVKQATPESIATLRRNVEAPLNGKFRCIFFQ